MNKKAYVIQSALEQNFIIKEFFFVWNTVKPWFIDFVRGPEKGQWIRENDRYGGLYKTEFVQGPQKLNTGSGKVIYLRTIDWAFTVFVNWTSQTKGVPKTETCKLPNYLSLGTNPTTVNIKQIYWVYEDTVLPAM
jgi:hypothetical protein